MISACYIEEVESRRDILFSDSNLDLRKTFFNAYSICFEFSFIILMLFRFTIQIRFFQMTICRKGGWGTSVVKHTKKKRIGAIKEKDSVDEGPIGHKHEQTKQTVFYFKWGKSLIH